LIRPDLVVTTLYTVMGDCTPELRFRDGERIATKVVAWSNTDRIVILQLEKPVKAKPLQPREPLRTLVVGEEVVVLTADEDDTEEQRSWRSPRLRWACPCSKRACLAGTAHERLRSPAVRGLP
jgi:hypothetical protein